MLHPLGGAQAIAALAYGTETVGAVDKIVGPGNAFVAEAKRQVFGRVGIDNIAGPSEVVIIADDSAHPEWVASDLIAQAEHDPLAQAILLTPSQQLLEQVARAVAEQFKNSPRQAILQRSLSDRSAFILTQSLSEAVTIADQFAPEHLELAVQDPHALLPKVLHAGAIFLGHFSAESLGDYCAGPNHVLPTSGTAKFSSPLGVYDFQKRSSLIDLSFETLQSTEISCKTFQIRNVPCFE